MSIEKKKNRFNALILLIVFILLDMIYQNIIVEIFGYMGFKQAPHSSFVCVLIYIIIAIVIYYASFKNKELFPSAILQLIAVFLVFPAAILFMNMQTDIQILLAHLLFYTMVYVSFRHVKIRVKGKVIRSDQRLPALFITALLMIIPFFITFKTNVNLSNFLLQDIYETRLAQRASNNVYLGYTYTWLAKIIIPAALIFAISSSSRIKSIILIILLAYLFLIGAHKSVFMGTIVILVFYYIPPRYLNLLISFGILSVLVVSLLSYSIIGNYYITGLVARRVFFIPALLDTYYFDFFKDKSLCWSDSILSTFIEYPYSLNPPHLIASHFFNKPEMSANNGIISDGYTNLGWIGIFLNITVVSLFFSAVNAMKIDHKFFGLFFVFFITLLSSALPTSLLTHGGILLILVSQLFLKDTISVNSLQ